MKTYEVHDNGSGQWALYQTGDGGFDLIGTFADQSDAEFGRLAFESR